jgi:hypothetical protein
MNALQLDIIETIKRHGPMTTAEICEYLEPLGYGGLGSYEDYKRHIGKTISKMKSEGHVTGKERPNPGTKPLMYWGLPGSENLGDWAYHGKERLVTHESVTAVPPENYAEMASDVVEAEQAGEWSDSKTFECQPEQAPEIPEPDYDPSTVAFPKRPMTLTDALMLFGRKDLEGQYMSAFLQGIAAAERFHGIAE